MPRQKHDLTTDQRLQGDAGVDQSGGVGVAQLVRGDVFESGEVGGAVELGADGSLCQSPAVVGEQELRRTPVAGVR